MKSKLLPHIAFAGSIIGALALGTPLAQAGTISFSGQDNGALLGGPFPNSIAAQTSFLAAAATFGTVSNHGFEGQPLGFQTTAYTFGNGDTFTLNATNFGPGFSGISNVTLGNTFGFSIGGVNNQWLGFPGGLSHLTSPRPVPPTLSVPSLQGCRTPVPLQSASMMAPTNHLRLRKTLMAVPSISGLRIQRHSAVLRFPILAVTTGVSTGSASTLRLLPSPHQSLELDCPV